jgi:hypothetical protein
MQRICSRMLTQGLFTHVKNNLSNIDSLIHIMRSKMDVQVDIDIMLQFDSI